MAAEQIPLTWLLRKRTPGKSWSEWIVCGKADFDSIKAKPLHWGMEYEAVAVVALADGVKACEKCCDSGWKPNLDANGERVWTPLMNDALPCECGALARRRAAEKAATGVGASDGKGICTEKSKP